VASYESAFPYIPPSDDLATLRSAVDGCRGCPLYADATQGVFGEGLARARMMLIGEQPGDQEDLEGRPFVGPAGKLLRAAIAEAELQVDVYVTNAVKHFKWQARGGRRLHAKPTRAERLACAPWLEREVEIVRPKVIVALGATAAAGVFGDEFRLTHNRGKVLMSRWHIPALATLHPSAILRMRSSQKRAAGRRGLREDLVVAWRSTL